MSGLSFGDVLDDSILVYMEDHTSFNLWIEAETGGGSDRMDLNLDKQQITYRPKFHKRNEVVARIHLVGSVGAESRSALWAWAHPQFADSPVATMSTRVRDFGESRGIPELSTPEWPIALHGPEGDEPGQDSLGDFATAMAATSCRITGIPTAQIMSGGGIRLVMLVDAAGFRPAAPSGERFPGILGRAVAATGWVRDHRRAVQGYAQARNLPYGWEPNFSALNIGFPEGNLRVGFDADGRAQEPQKQFNPPA